MSYATQKLFNGFDGFSSVITEGVGGGGGGGGVAFAEYYTPYLCENISTLERFPKRQLMNTTLFYLKEWPAI